MREGSLYTRLLEDGRELTVYPMTFGKARLCIGPADDAGSRTHHNEGEQSAHAIRVSLEEALILQSFPPDYPVQGTKSQRFLQVGNAVPPLLASAILSALIPAEFLVDVETKAAA